MKLIIIVYFIVFFNSLISTAQDRILEKIQFGFGVSSGITREVYHITPQLTININGRHELFACPAYTYIYESIGDPVDTYKPDSFGAFFGYRNYFKKFSESLNFFGQLDFSIYQLKRIVYQHGLPYTNEYSNIIVENSGTLGLEYKLANRIYLFSGIGIQSYKGFFLMIERFSPCAYAGIEYRFE